MLPTLADLVGITRHWLRQTTRLRLTILAFRGRDSKAPPLLIICLQHHSQTLKSWLVITYPNATSSDAITGLSFTAICKGCPSQYRRFQVSPQRPDTSRCPQQPTCREYVVPSQAPHIRDFHPFKINRDHVVTYVPVSVSPSLTLLRGLGRTGEFHPRTPVVAVPAQLQAYGFGSRC